MATLRFGLPSPSDREQIVLRARKPNPSVPVPGEWETWFPYAMGITSTALNATFRVIGGTSTESVDADSTAGLQKTLFHPDSGLLPNGITDICLYNGNSSAIDTLRSLVPGKVRIIAGLENQGFSASNGWLSRGTVPNDNYATLDGIATTALEPYQDNPDVMAYILADDVNASTDPKKTLTEQAIDRVQALDIVGRPASPSLLGGNPAPSDPKVTVAFGGSYASRWLSTGVKRLEGDFTIPDAGLDWQRILRLYILDRLDERVWIWMGAHQLGDGSGGFPNLSYPTKREIRKMVWEGVGSGAKGFLWFIYQDLAGTWDGLAHPNSRERLEGVAEMNRRLTPNIRARLLRCRPTSSNNEFTVSGGGSANWVGVDYSEAYVSTLHDSNRNEYLVVVCNRATTTQTITITASSMVGTLINLEDKTEISAAGGQVTLGPLDGTIFRFYDQPDSFTVYLRDGTEVTL